MNKRKVERGRVDGKGERGLKSKEKNENLLYDIDFDPEDFETEDHSAAKVKHVEYSHYHDSNLKGNRKRIMPRNDDIDLGVGKYKGTRVDRKTLNMQKIKDDFDENKDLDYLDSSDDSSFSFHSDSLDDSENDQSNDEILKKSQNPIQKNKNEKEKKKMKIDLEYEMKQLDERDQENLVIIADRIKQDSERGKAVKEQINLIDDIIGLRLGLQPLIQAVNRLPSQNGESVDPTILSLSSHANVAAKFQTFLCDLVALFKLLQRKEKRILKDQNQDLDKNQNQKQNNIQNQIDNYPISKSHLGKIIGIEKILLPSCRQIIDSTHQRLLIISSKSSSGTSKNNQLKIINSSPWQQVELALSRADNSDLVLRKTHPHENSKDIHNKEIKKESLFEDEDLYNFLLKDWLQRNGSSSSSSSSNIISLLPGHYQSTDSSLGKNKITNKNMEAKVSKGRKIKYDVHEKMCGYMASMPYHHAWTDQRITELIATIKSIS